MFKNPFSFEGRIRRLEYGLAFIIYMVCYVVFLFTAETVGGNAALIGLLFVIPAVWFLWAQGAKRCHDLGKSGWWQIIPFYGFFLLFKNGEPGMNSYGSNPKGIAGLDGQLNSMDSETLDAHLRN